MRKSNVFILCGVAAAILMVVGLSFILKPAPKTMDQNAPTVAPLSTQKAQETSAPEDGTKTPEQEKAFLLVTVAGQLYTPISLEEEGEFVIEQKEGELRNVVKVTKDSVVMQSASCDNQQCVHQGEVTLENKDTRLLGNMIICLPNEVVLEMYTQTELEALFKNAQSAQE